MANAPSFWHVTNGTCAAAAPVTAMSLPLQVSPFATAVATASPAPLDVPRTLQCAVAQRHGRSTVRGCVLQELGAELLQTAVGIRFDSPTPRFCGGHCTPSVATTDGVSFMEGAPGGKCSG